MPQPARKEPLRISFSKTALEALARPGKGQRTTVYDAKVPKLACRVTHAGTRTFYVVTRAALGMEWIQLGTLSDLTVEQARKKAAKVLGQFAEGINPAETRRQSKAEMTLGEAFETYMRDHVEAHKIKSAADLRQLWERCVGDLPMTPRKKHARQRTKHPSGVNWQHRKLSLITKGDIQKLHVAIGKTTPVLANRVIELISAIYNQREVLNPTSGVKPFREKQRDRFLQESELPRFFEALAKDTSNDFRDFVMLSLMTGARRGNVLGMRWSDIDEHRAIWRIRGEEFKNGEPVDVPLADVVVGILDRRKAMSSSTFVFPAKSATGHMTPPKKRWAELLDRAELDELQRRIAVAGGVVGEHDGVQSLSSILENTRRMAKQLNVDTGKARLKDLRLHDLRRSLGSWQTMLGASLPVVGRSLGHKSAGATAIYARLQIDPVRTSVEAASRKMLELGGLPTLEDPE